MLIQGKGNGDGQCLFFPAMLKPLSLVRALMLDEVQWREWAAMYGIITLTLLAGLP